VFPTAMNQWDARSSVPSRKEVWRRAIEAGSAVQRARLPTFFGSGTRKPIGLPMSSDCCQWLANAPPAKVFPWGDKFKDTSDDGAQDESFGLVDCGLILESEGSAAQPVDLQIRIKARQGLSSIEIPAPMDLRSGHIEIHVTSPDGLSRKYRTRSRSCGNSRQRLERGSVLRRNYTLLGDAGGVLFPVPGKYLLEAVLPTLGARSGPMIYEVSHAVGPFASAEFQRFLANDLPRGDEVGWRLTDQVLASREVAARTKAFLRSKAAARDRQPFMPLDALRRDASSRVQEKDALLRVVRNQRLSTDGTGALQRSIDEAEEVLRKIDASNPSMQYLEHVRQRTRGQVSNKRR
jgi:hypothetical protein